MIMYEGKQIFYLQATLTRGKSSTFCAVTGRERLNEKIKEILCKSSETSFTKLGYQNPIDETRLSGVRELVFPTPLRSMHGISYVGQWPDNAITSPLTAIISNDNDANSYVGYVE